MSTTTDKFRMSIIKHHPTAMGRQISESVLINNNNSDFALNSKSEWNSAKIPRIVVEVGDQARVVEYSGKAQTPRPITFPTKNIKTKLSLQTC